MIQDTQEPSGDSLAGCMAEGSYHSGLMGQEQSGFSERYPFLDLIATSSHTPDSCGDEWRRMLIQPVCIPSLSHTGIRCKFDEYADPVMTPNGAVTVQFKKTIHKELRALPQFPYVSDVSDVKRRDREKVCEKVTSETCKFHIGGRRWKSSVSVSRDAATTASLTAPTAPEASVFSGRRRMLNTKGRLKRPFSRDSLLQSMLDWNFEPQEKPYDWAVDGVPCVINT